ncbi:MotA/TolQ/ExbB proton channel family protein [Shewanella intestini]|uniref:Flagellar motor protein MotA n=1 Tax=Shewanella intestini TaxID=2017544 RepID=A0ABS5HYP1_9GAMM|nr:MULTISPECIES: MotA/TolQ/ExbB proton channel family protein [Shewanella]MBR9726907.1 flagellar motor protein MotA [Shewanella intestini]MRG34527.1 flagellar motor protein MotA [Shewanella sp. XMDDZSB0408]
MRTLLMLFLLCSSSVVVASTQLTNNQAAAKEDLKYQQVDKTVAANAKQLNLENKQWRERLHNEISQVKNDEAQLARRLKDKQKQLQQLNASITEFTAKKQHLTVQYKAAVDDLELVKGTYQKGLTTLSAQWQHAPTRLVNDKRNDALLAAIADKDFPSVPVLDKLVKFAINDMQLTGKITNNDTVVATADGSVSNRNVSVVGGLMAVLADKPYGYLELSETTPLAVIPAKSATSKQLAQWIKQTSSLLPMDLSQGEMLSAVGHQQTLAQWIEKGGEVLWPILILAALGLIIIIWRGALLFYWRPMPEYLANQASMANENNLTQVKQQLKNIKRTPSAKALADAIANSSNIESMDQRLQNAMLKQMSAFERGLGFIALLAAMAPMLGLLGTVSGMIETFQSLTQFGNSDPKLLSEGISKALITTQAGLIVALPLLLLHYPLKRRAQKLSLDMERQASLLLAQHLDQGELNVD